MDAREFDELITRIAQASSRRTAVKGVLGGALAGVGVAAAADAKDKKKGKGKGRTHGKGKARSDKGRGVTSEHNGGNGKRTMCLCQEAGGTTVAPTSSTSTTNRPTTSDRLPNQVSGSASNTEPHALVCETRTFKTKKARKALRDNPGSYRGPCTDATTTTSTSTSTTTIITVTR